MLVLTCNNAERRITILATASEEKSSAPFFWLASYVLNDQARLMTDDTMEYIWSDPINNSVTDVASVDFWQLILAIKHGSSK